MIDSNLWIYTSLNLVIAHYGGKRHTNPRFTLFSDLSYLHIIYSYIHTGVWGVPVSKGIPKESFKRVVERLGFVCEKLLSLKVLPFLYLFVFCLCWVPTNSRKVTHCTHLCVCVCLSRSFRWNTASLLLRLLLVLSATTSLLLLRRDKPLFIRCCWCLLLTAGQHLFITWKTLRWKCGRCRCLREVALVLCWWRRLQLWIGLFLVFDAFDVGVVGRGQRRLTIFELAEGRVICWWLIIVLHLLARLLLIGVPVGLELVVDLLHGIKWIWGGADQLQLLLLSLTWRWIVLVCAVQIWMGCRRLIWNRIAKSSNTLMD